MNNPFRIVAASIFIIVFISTVYGQCPAPAHDGPCTHPSNPGQPVKYVFTGTDDIPDVVVKITMHGIKSCNVTVTRLKVKGKEINRDYCSDKKKNPWLHHSTAITEQPGTGPGAKDKKRSSVYKIESSNCTPNEFPADIDIYYYGEARRARGTNAYQMRMVHKDGSDCTDVTYEIDDDPDPDDATEQKGDDPKGGGGEGGFSEFFLVNIRDVSLPNENRVDTKMNQIINKIPLGAPVILKLATDARTFFDDGVDLLQQGNQSAATTSLNDAIDKENDLCKQVLSSSLSQADKTWVHVRARAAIFTIQQYMELNGLTPNYPTCP